MQSDSRCVLKAKPTGEKKKLKQNSISTNAFIVRHFKENVVYSDYILILKIGDKI